jgi:hypothetical protein
MDDSISDGKTHLRIDNIDSRLRLDNYIKIPKVSKPTTTLEESDSLLDETLEDAISKPLILNEINLPAETKQLIEEN